jgi:RNA polymerase sigma factor (sigma-70 family)
VDRDLQQLINAVQAGDRAAFEELHARFAGFVRRQVEARVPTRARDLVDEIIQEVWRAVYGQVERYDSNRATFTRWLGVIATRKAITWVNQLLVREAGLTRLSTWAPSQYAQERPDAALRGTEMMAAIQTCTKTLATREREMFCLARLNDMSIEELATTTGVSVGRARGALSDATRKMLECLSQKGLL